jgi:hypothetical protein
MTNVTGVGRTYGAEGIGSPTNLDGDTLLAYCASQLNDLNLDIKARLTTQQQVRDTKALLNDVRTLIQSKTDGTYDDRVKEEILTKYATAIQSMPEGPMRSRVMSSFQEFRKTACYNGGQVPEPPHIGGYLAGGYKDDLKVGDDGNGGNKLDQGEISAQVAGLGAIAEDLGKNVEMDMITLNQLVSARQMAIQLTSQLMAKMNQGAEACVNNIK